MSAEKRIPVTEETWEELGELKKSGQTWDELLEVLAQEHKKARFVREMDAIRENQEFVPLDEE